MQKINKIDNYKMFSFSEKQFIDYENMITKSKTDEYNIIKHPVIKYADNEKNKIEDKNKDINRYFELELFIAENFNKIRKTESNKGKDLNKLKSKLVTLKSINKNVNPETFEIESDSYFKLYKQIYNGKDYIINSKWLTNIMLEELPEIKKKDIDSVKIEKKVKNKKPKEEAKSMFKNEEECSTKKRSLKHYYSKDDLIKIIMNDDKIKKKFPKNIKALSKEEICKIYFSKEKAKN